MIVCKTIVVAAAVIASASAGRSQSVSWSAPVVDHFYDGGAASIKAVAGVPGAASIDGVVASAVKLQAAYIAPGKRFALARSVDDETVLLDWTGPTAIVRDLPGAPAGVDAVAFSRSGNFAAVFSRSSGKVQIWRGLPGDPAVQHEIASDSSVLAVADDGTLAAVQSDGIYWIESGGAKLVAAGDYSAIAFRPGTRDLAATGTFSDTVIVIGAGGGSSTLAAADAGISEPVALAFSSDGATLVIANRRGRSAVVVDIAAGTATAVACGCTPSVVAPAAARGVFRLTGSTGDGVVFLHAGSAAPRVFTVPDAGGSR
jgi:hypothetical protein